jgi:lysophospholipase L1-like esterase
MVPDAIVEHIITAATGVTQELMIRRVDDNNCWIIRMDQAGSTVKLIEKVGGVETEKGSAAQTWTHGTQFRIVVSAEAYHILVYVGTTAKINYNSAYSNSTATGIKVSRAGTELVAWPKKYNISVGVPVVTKSFWPYGDSKTNGQSDTTPPALGQNGYPPLLAASLQSTTGNTWREFPLRIGRSSFTVNSAGVSMLANLDADLATRYDAPDYILCNLGVNDLPLQLTTDPTGWQTDYQTILDRMHARWPNAKIGLQRVWRSGVADASLNTVDDTYIPNVIAGRSWAFLGGDERLSTHIKGTDSGATYTADGIHPNHAGYIRTSDAWASAIAGQGY